MVFNHHFFIFNIILIKKKNRTTKFDKKKKKAVFLTFLTFCYKTKIPGPFFCHNLNVTH